MKIAFNPLRDMLIAIVLASVLFYALARWKQSQRGAGHQLFFQFDSANIRGKIDTAWLREGVQSFRVEREGKDYHFIPGINRDGEMFQAIAEKGDSLIKPSFSSFILVVKKGTVHRFTFKKF